MEFLHRKATIAIAVVVLLVSVIFVWRTVSPKSPALDRKPYISVGQVLADETVKLLGERGHLTVVINAKNNEKGDPAHDEWENFQSSLKAHSAIQITAVETLGDDPDDVIPGAGCSRKQLAGVVEKHTADDAIVFLFSLPEWAMARTQMPLNVHPKLIVADHTMVGTRTQYGGYFDSANLVLLITRRRGGAPADNGNAQLDPRFEIFTPANDGALPE